MGVYKLAQHFILFIFLQTACTLPRASPPLLLSLQETPTVQTAIKSRIYGTENPDLQTIIASPGDLRSHSVGQYSDSVNSPESFTPLQYYSPAPVHYVASYKAPVNVQTLTLPSKASARLDSATLNAQTNAVSLSNLLGVHYLHLNDVPVSSQSSLSLAKTKLQFHNPHNFVPRTIVLPSSQNAISQNAYEEPAAIHYQAFISPRKHTSLTEGVYEKSANFRKFRDTEDGVAYDSQNTHKLSLSLHRHPETAKARASLGVRALPEGTHEDSTSSRKYYKTKSDVAFDSKRGNEISLNLPRHPEIRVRTLLTSEGVHEKTENSPRYSETERGVAFDSQSGNEITLNLTKHHEPLGVRALSERIHEKSANSHKYSETEQSVTFDSQSGNEITLNLPWHQLQPVPKKPEVSAQAQKDAETEQGFPETVKVLPLSLKNNLGKFAHTQKYAETEYGRARVASFRTPPLSKGVHEKSASSRKYSETGSVMAFESQSGNDITPNLPQHSETIKLRILPAAERVHEKSANSHKYSETERGVVFDSQEENEISLNLHQYSESAKVRPQPLPELVGKSTSLPKYTGVDSERPETTAIRTLTLPEEAEEKSVTPQKYTEAEHNLPETAVVRTIILPEEVYRSLQNNADGDLDHFETVVQRLSQAKEKPVNSQNHAQAEQSPAETVVLRIISLPKEVHKQIDHGRIESVVRTLSLPKEVHDKSVDSQKYVKTEVQTLSLPKSVHKTTESLHSYADLEHSVALNDKERTEIFLDLDKQPQPANNALVHGLLSLDTKEGQIDPEELGGIPGNLHKYASVESTLSYHPENVRRQYPETVKVQAPDSTEEQSKISLDSRYNLETLARTLVLQKEELQKPLNQQDYPEPVNIRILVSPEKVDEKSSNTHHYSEAVLRKFPEEDYGKFLKSHQLDDTSNLRTWTNLADVNEQSLETHQQSELVRSRGTNVAKTLSREEGNFQKNQQDDFEKVSVRTPPHHTASEDLQKHPPHLRADHRHKILPSVIHTKSEDSYQVSGPIKVRLQTTSLKADEQSQHFEPVDSRTYAVPSEKEFLVISPEYAIGKKGLAYSKLFQNHQIDSATPWHPSILDLIIEDRVIAIKRFTYEFNRLIDDVSSFLLSFVSKNNHFGGLSRKSLFDFSNLGDLQKIYGDIEYLAYDSVNIFKKIAVDIEAFIYYVSSQPHYGMGSLLQNGFTGLFSLFGNVPQILFKSLNLSRIADNFKLLS